MNTFRPLLIAFLLCNISSTNEQADEAWMMEILSKYSQTSFSIISQYKQNGQTISFGNSSITSVGDHIHYCDFSSKEKLLESMSVNLHETVHGFDSQIPYMQAKQGKFTFENLNTEGFYIDDNTQFSYKFPANHFFQSRKLVAVIPEHLRTFRFETYILSPSLENSTQIYGIIGLMEEFNAYYHGSKMVYDLLPVYKEIHKNDFFHKWSSKFTANADAFYEFDFFIKEYLLLAKTNYPSIYNELAKDEQFRLIYKTIRNRFSQLISNYEKKYDELKLTTKSETKEGWTIITKKHTELIYPILAEHINSSKYQEINRVFLSN